MARYVLLGLLRGGERLHGYALVKTYRDLVGANVNSGNFYRELQRLAGEGLVARLANDRGDDPHRQQFEITAAGMAVFDGWFALVADGAVAGGEDELSLRTLFFGKIDAGLARHVLQRWRAELWFRGQVLERERDAERLRRTDAARAAFPARASLLTRRLRHVAADLEFLDELRGTYEAWLAESARGMEAIAAASTRRVRRAARGH